MQKTAIFTYIQLFLVVFLFTGCNQDDDPATTDPLPPAASSAPISAVDISAYPQIALSNPTFYNLEGDAQDFLDIIKASGVNTIRLKLWVDPADGHSGFEEVKQFSQQLKAKGFKTWLTLHYSDTWADPGQQITPERWQGISFAALQDSVSRYTERVVTEMRPDYIQVGNEINVGLLHPQGHLIDQNQQFTALMRTAITAVRTHAEDARIILHFAGLEGADWFFDQTQSLDFDIIGLSYYPIWHGTSTDDLRSTLNQLSATYNKEVLVAETAYPFTLDWADWTNNIVGLEEQLVPGFPATPEGQRSFVAEIRQIVLEEVDNGIGFCYWGAELIAWRGEEATDGSPWENQALFNFENEALPVLREFDLGN